MGTGEYQTKSPVNATKSVNPGFVKNVYFLYTYSMYVNYVNLCISHVY